MMSKAQTKNGLSVCGHAQAGWREVKLGEIAEVIGGGTPKTSATKYWNGDIPWLTPRDLTGYKKIYINRGERNITKAGLENSSARLMPKGTILLTSRAPIGYLAIAQNKVTTNQGFKSLVVDKCKAHNIFVYYWLKANIEYLQSIGTGSTFAEIAGSVVKEIEILLPPLPEQKAIAEVLSSFDDKIDLLHRQNKTLEDMAQALFRKWFVEEANEGWEVGKLGDVLKIIESGSRPKGGIDPNLTDGIPSVGAESINGIGNFNFTRTKYISYEYYQKMKRGIVKDYDVLIYKDGAYIGKKAMFAKGFPFKKFVINEHVFILRSNNRINQIFLYFILITQELRKLNANSAQPGLNQTSMRSLDIIIPPKEKVDRFEKVAIEWINKIFYNNIQIRTLESLRDTILPKLMSGKIRVRF